MLTPLRYVQKEKTDKDGMNIRGIINKIGKSVLEFKFLGDVKARGLL